MSDTFKIGVNPLVSITAAGYTEYTEDLVQTVANSPTAKVGVLGFVDDTHPPAAEFFDDAIMRDRLADHWAEMLGLEIGQVNEVRKSGKS